MSLVYIFSKLCGEKRNRVYYDFVWAMYRYRGICKGSKKNAGFLPRSNEWLETRYLKELLVYKKNLEVVDTIVVIVSSERAEERWRSLEVWGHRFSCPFPFLIDALSFRCWSIKRHKCTIISSSRESRMLVRWAQRLIGQTVSWLNVWILLHLHNCFSKIELDHDDLLPVWGTEVLWRRRSCLPACLPCT